MWLARKKQDQLGKRREHHARKVRRPAAKAPSRCLAPKADFCLLFV